MLAGVPIDGSHDPGPPPTPHRDPVPISGFLRLEPA